MQFVCADLAMAGSLCYAISVFLHKCAGVILWKSKEEHDKVSNGH